MAGILSGLANVVVPVVGWGIDETWDPRARPEEEASGGLACIAVCSTLVR